MKVWFDARKGMWDWSADVTDKNCLAVDGPAQDKVYADTGWTAMRGQRLDDSVDDSKRRNHYAIQAVVAFPSGRDAAAFYKSSAQAGQPALTAGSPIVSPGQPDTVWTVAEVPSDNGTLEHVGGPGRRQRLDLPASADRAQQRRHRRRDVRLHPTRFGGEPTSPRRSRRRWLSSRRCSGRATEPSS